MTANLSSYEKSSLCTVCNHRRADGVRSSYLCRMPVPFNICWECGKEGLVPWGLLVHPIVGLSVEHRTSLVSWEAIILKRICEFYDRSEEELWEAVEAAQRERLL